MRPKAQYRRSNAVSKERRTDRKPYLVVRILRYVTSRDTVERQYSDCTGTPDWMLRR